MEEGSVVVGMINISLGGQGILTTVQTFPVEAKECVSLCW